MKRNLLLIALCLPAALACTASATIIYVDDDAPPGGDGRSWATACTYLQDALADANTAEKPVDIYVAQGLYSPDRNSAHPQGTGDRTATFRLIDDVAVRGGYAGGNAPDPNARDIVLYETVLSGDLAGDDVSVPDPCDLLTEPTRAENSYAVATAGPCSRSAVLEGIVVCSGNAIGPERHQVHQTGAGLLLSQYGADCCPSIRDCTFRGHCAHRGGAAYVIGARPELVNCKFLHNAAVQGGVIEISEWRVPWSSACNFVIRRCRFVGNYAADAGGAVHMGAGLRFAIDGSTFARNSARTGGAMHISVGANITNCLFTENSATESGGALYCDGYKLNIASCTFSGNTAPAGLALTCFTPVTTIANTIFWNGGDDRHAEIFIGAITGMDARYNNIQGGWPLGEGNIDADPMFADPDNGDYHLKSQAGRWNAVTESWVQDDVTSPCIDTGDPNSPIGYEPFPNGGRINMGAYGGTAEASKSYFGEPVCQTVIAGDINGDCRVDFADLAILLKHWLDRPEQGQE